MSENAGKIRMQKVTWREGEVAADAEFNNQKSKIGD